MKAKWTALFLVHAADGRTRKYADELFKILEACNYNKEVNVLVLYGSLQSSDSDGYRIQVVLKKIFEDAVSDDRSLKEIKSFGVIDMGDDRALAPIFSEIKKSYPSERFLLFTWDHGSGFGIFKTNPIEGRRDISRSSSPSSSDQEYMVADMIIGLHNDSKDRGIKRVLTAVENKVSLQVITNEPLEEIYEEGLRGLGAQKKEKDKNKHAYQ